MLLRKMRSDRAAKRLLVYGDSFRGARALKTLAALEPERGASIAQRLLATANNDAVRLEALLLLDRAADRDPELARAFVAAVDDRSGGVAATAIECIGRHRWERGLPAVRHKLLNGRPKEQQRACVAIVQFGDKDSRASLEQLAEGSEEAVAVAARRALEALQGLR